ncbi:MAG: hypothetical protein ACIAQ0_07300 [Phycisphaerales bacterium JB058]
MSTCCPNCSAAAFGTDAASVCTDCATATVAGASFSLPTMLATTVCAVALVLAYKAIRRMWRRTPSHAMIPA